MFFREKLPSPRQHFTFNKLGNKEKEMLLFGGQRLPGDHYFNDVWIFNF